MAKRLHGGLSRVEAWSDGVQVVKVRESPEVMTYLRAELERVVQYLDMKKTFQKGEMADVVFNLVSDFYYLKLEEFLIVFDGIKKGEFGDYYERFYLPELYKAFKVYDQSEQRAEMIERHHSRVKAKMVVEVEDWKEVYDDAVERLKTEKVKVDTDKDYQKVRAEYYKTKLNESE